MAKATKNKKFIHRSAETGRIVSKDFAEKNKATTVKETITKKQKHGNEKS